MRKAKKTAKVDVSAFHKAFSGSDRSRSESGGSTYSLPRFSKRCWPRGIAIARESAAGK